MPKIDIVKKWLDRAQSNLTLAKPVIIHDDVFYEDLCFNAQQCVEKSLKALLIYNNLEYPKSHSISKLLGNLEEAGIKFPLFIRNSASITDYSVEKRYPGDYDEVYQKVVKIAERVFFWVNKKIKLK